MVVVHGGSGGGGVEWWWWWWWWMVVVVVVASADHNPNHRGVQGHAPPRARARCCGVAPEGGREGGGGSGGRGELHESDQAAPLPGVPTNAGPEQCCSEEIQEQRVVEHEAGAAILCACRATTHHGIRVKAMKEALTQESSGGSVVNVPTHHGISVKAMKEALTQESSGGSVVKQSMWRLSTREAVGQWQ